ncbi:glycosyltransferase family 2 protein [Gammaproteobacteria bacterium]|nr:glycosyltransferase family 2 protein [Gammaproteobacteria bacterium]
MKLSIVIATYNMQREAPRTLMSVLPPCQREVQNIDYEVIVIDNGSVEPLDLSCVDSANVPVKVIRVSPSNAHLSPIVSINNTVALHARGEWLLICIDGARFFSPYLIRRTVDTLKLYPNAFTFVESRHLGHETQMKASAKGYDQKVEDELINSVDWRSNLDALWDIRGWAGAHDEKNHIFQNESNAIGLSCNLWNELGGYHLGFQRPGGGLCNLEFFERAVTRDRGLNVLLYGETTFHQFHGGAATGSTTYFRDSLAEHEEVKGHAYLRPKYDFLADLGATHLRMQTVGNFLRE